MEQELQQFMQTVKQYYSENKRSFPWRETTDPYAIMVSEFMLQQTQTDRVVPKYQTFMKSFPTIKSLAKASQSKIVSYWSGLGYNRRALFLHRTANEVLSRFNGTIPRDIHSLESLPGIGPYTAAAISTFAFNQPHVFIETNIRTVFIHQFFKDAENISDNDLKPFIEKTIDRDNPREWYYALMDYGSYLKKILPNPSLKSKHHVKQSTFEGSTRQIRGAILKELLQTNTTDQHTLAVYEQFSEEMVVHALQSLEKEGFITTDKNTVSLKK